jgi:hypothetical protein
MAMGSPVTAQRTKLPGESTWNSPSRYRSLAVKAGEVELEFADGRADAVIEVDSARQTPPTPVRKAPATAPRPAQAQQKMNDPQGQLF